MTTIQQTKKKKKKTFRQFFSCFRVVFSSFPASVFFSLVVVDKVRDDLNTFFRIACARDNT